MAANDKTYTRLMREAHQELRAGNTKEAQIAYNVAQQFKVQPAKRYRLKLATWLVVREPGQSSNIILNSPEKAALLAQEIVHGSDDDKEHFWVIFLNPRHRYLMHTLVSMGTQTSSLVDPREIFGPALREGAHAIILLHNHPSGDPVPSPEDRELTRKFVECGKLLGVELLDHLIVGNGTGQWVSLRDRGDF